MTQNTFQQTSCSGQAALPGLTKHKWYVEESGSLLAGNRNLGIKQLATAQAWARLIRLVERMRSQRRVGLTAIALVLSVVWLGQAIYGVMYRASASADTLLVWIPLSLGIYFIWNFLKSAGQKPIEPFEWSETEREWLLAAPLPRTELIAYRFSAIARSALIKSLIFGFVMIPDLPLVPLGFLGILAALVFIDLVRLIVEAVVWGSTKRELLFFRALVFGAAAIVVGRAVLVTLNSEQLALHVESPDVFGCLIQFINALCSQANTWYGKLLLFPFSQIASVIVAERMDLAVLARVIVFGSGLLVLSRAMIHVDRFFLSRRTRLERDHLASATWKVTQNDSADSRRVVRKPRSFRGSGGLAWRQFLGAWEFRGSLAISLLIPAILSCMPAMAGSTGFALVGNTVGALAFYSLILLPACLKFDFRRDVDRLVMLKSYPVTAFRAVVGQLAVPIVLATLFQLFSLLLVMILSPYNLLLLVAGIVFLLPFNLFIFSFENLTFLWFPHRMRQEGMQVLLRSILVFTAKSLIFAAVFAGSYIWVLTARWIHDSFLSGHAWLTTVNLFGAGMLLAAVVIAGMVFALLVRAFEKFDPSCDLVAVD